MLPTVALEGAPDRRRSRVVEPAGELARELLWDVSRGESWVILWEQSFYI